MATTDAHPLPRKNVAYRHYFGIFKNDGTLITGAAGLAGTVSKDGAAFASTTNTPTEISGSGIYFIDLTATEVNTNSSVVKVTSSTTGAVVVVLALFPQQDGDVQVTFDNLANTLQRLGVTEEGTLQSVTSTTVVQLAAAASADNNAYAGNTIVFESATTGAKQAALILSYVGSTKTVTLATALNTALTGTVVYKIFATGPSAILGGIPTAAQNAVAVWDELASGHLVIGSYGMVFQPIRTGTAQAGAANSITLDASANATDAFYANTLLRIITGTGAGQARYISTYTGTTKVAVVNGNWVTNPDNTSVFAILNGAAIVGASAPTAAQNAAAVWDELSAGHTINNSFGQILQPIRTGVAAAGASGTITLDGGASSINSFYTDALLRIVSGAGAGQARSIVGYVGATKVATMSNPWVTNPDNTSVFAIYNLSGVSVHNTGWQAMLDADIGKPTAVVSGTWSVRKIVQWLGALGLWKITETATTQTLRNETDSANIATSTQSDDATTYTRSAWV